MARPKKQEVDYFPHYCDHGKVLFILENHFKNDGYAVFYKLEELLSKTEGHCYDCSRLENWEYLLSRMGTTEEIVTGVIEKLSAMAVIDAPLWKEKRIWMQSFMDSISDAYARRKVDLPTKPELMLPLIRLSGINDDINPQRKLKERKLKETKGKEIADIILPEWMPAEQWDAFVEMRKEIKKPLTGRAIQLAINKLQDLKNEGHDPGRVLDESILGKWQGLFPLKNNGKGGGNRHAGIKAWLERDNEEARQGEICQGDGSPVRDI